MYCPVCLNNTLYIKSRGVMNIVVNGKQMDSGRFLYDFERDRSHFISDLSTKLEEFFKWYSNFQNIETITKVEISTIDVSCESGCHMPPATKYSVFDGNQLKKVEVGKILSSLGKKYNLEIELID